MAHEDHVGTQHERADAEAERERHHPRQPGGPNHRHGFAAEAIPAEPSTNHQGGARACQDGGQCTGSVALQQADDQEHTAEADRAFEDCGPTTPQKILASLQHAQHDRSPEKHQSGQHRDPKRRGVGNSQSVADLVAQQKHGCRHDEPEQKSAA